MLILLIFPPVVGQTGANNVTNLDLRGTTIQSLNTGQMTVTNVSGSRNVAIGNDAKFIVNESQR